MVLERPDLHVVQSVKVLRFLRVLGRVGEISVLKFRLTCAWLPPAISSHNGVDKETPAGKRNFFSSFWRQEKILLKDIIQGFHFMKRGHFFPLKSNEISLKSFISLIFISHPMLKE
jgi:hypothetical protein